MVGWVALSAWGLCCLRVVFLCVLWVCCWFCVVGCFMELFRLWLVSGLLRGLVCVKFGCYGFALIPVGLGLLFG